MALEVFTSREGAEAELRGMERLASRGGLLRGIHERVGQFAGGEFNKAASEEVVELLEILKGSDLTYVLINPPPLDGPIPGSLSIRDATTFAGELRRHLLGTISREHV